MFHSLTTTARKTIFSFPKYSENGLVILLKNCTGIRSEKMKFVFPENMILFFEWNMKDDPSQRNTCKYDNFLYI